MTAVIKSELMGVICTLEDGTVTCKGQDADMVDIMQRAADYELEHFDPSGADPNPELTLATRIAEAFDGEVTSHDEAEYDPDVVY
jgi:hypothetical protein